LCPAADSSSSLSGNTEIGKSNMVTDLTASNTSIPSAYQSMGIPAVVKDFYSNNRGASATGAFTAQADSYATAPSADVPLRMNGSTTTGLYAATVADITGSTSYSLTWETLGYAQYTGKAFSGYTIGPRYWGKTFYIWPPDPTNDWRKKYFFLSNGTTA